MKEYSFNVEGIEITVLPSDHANSRMNTRSITGYQVSGALMALGEEILDMKNGTEFMIIDETLDAAYVFGLNVNKIGEIFIDIITVIDTKEVWVKKGTQVLKYAS